LLREVAIEGDRTYFDTNTSNHFHYYMEEEDRLFDIETPDLSVNGLPPPPSGTKVARIDVIVRLRCED
jgi:Fur family transcriptional regulator, iron response regulator